MNDLVAPIVGLCTGAAMSVAVSSVWCVLHLPARLQDRLRAGTPRLLTWAIALGLLLSAAQQGAWLSLRLPQPALCASFLAGGVFVGMLASSLGEILEVTPVLMRRLRLGDISVPLRFALTLSKGLGAVIACLVFTL